MSDYLMNLKFELEDEDGLLTREFTVADLTSWTELVLKFADFLSAQYGYSMQDRIVFVTDYPTGREVEHAISKNEYEMILSNRKRSEAIDSLWGDDE